MGMSKTATLKRDSKSGRYDVAGRADDGVEILVPAARPKNFTFRQIKKTVEMVKSKRNVQRDASTGRFAAPAPRDR